MPDISNPDIKKNDAAKDTSNTNIGVKESTPSSNSTSTPIPVVKIKQEDVNNVEIKYPIEDLIENSKALTGSSKAAAVGALFNCKEKELTKDNFKKIIKDFLGKKVK